MNENVAMQAGAQQTKVASPFANTTAVAFTAPTLGVHKAYCGIIYKTSCSCMFMTLWNMAVTI